MAHQRCQTDRAMSQNVDQRCHLLQLVFQVSSVQRIRLEQSTQALLETELPNPAIGIATTTEYTSCV